jgi:hypothetical protein
VVQHGLRGRPTRFCVVCGKDREVDHGEEVKGEEEIHKEEGRSGAQEENNEVGCEEVDEKGDKEGGEEDDEEGCSKAQGAGEETRPDGA